ncbi:hypothetical protein [Microcoleus sp. S13_B4]|uniref:hypothetical protein n=1 Tax=Microcoleus sp. S13_B4 TaxID=3055408 RepID=UPI002FD31002
MLNSVLILPENNLKSLVADDGKHLIDNTPYYSRTNRLIELLEDVGVIYFDSTTTMYSYTPFIEGDRQNGRARMVAKMLGYTAEGIVVRECNSDSSKNAKWANIARLLREDKNQFSNLIKKIFWYPFQQNPDNYHAVGTGLAKTNTQNPSWYSRQSDRDICWIDSATKARELLVPKNITSGKRKNAGIQLKVSSSPYGRYVTDYFKRKPYFTLYPVVYFDLGNDFYQVRANLLNLTSFEVQSNSLFSSDVQFSEGLSRGDIVDMMLLRGRDIDASLHDELLYYQSIFNSLASGGISLFDLTDEKVIFGLITDFLGKNVVQDSSILTISYS